MTDDDRTPDPSRFEALQGQFFQVEYHDNHPDNYEVTGALPGEGDWEHVDEASEPHIALRRKAFALVPEMIRELVAAHRLLTEQGISTQQSPLSQIGETLSELQAEGESLALQSFVVVRNTTGGRTTVPDSIHHTYAGAAAMARVEDARPANAGTFHYVVPV